MENKILSLQVLSARTPKYIRILRHVIRDEQEVSADAVKSIIPESYQVEESTRDLITLLQESHISIPELEK